MTQNEIAVIGSLLISPETIEVISATLTPSDFENELCRATYAAALRLRDYDEVIDPIPIADQLIKDGFGDRAKWLMDCMLSTPTASNVELYCRIVKEDANRRRLYEIAEQIGCGVDNRTDWQEIAALATESINDISGSSSSNIITSSDMASGWLDYYKKVAENPEFAYCRTGFKSLDAKLGGGMFKSGMYIIGARPGMGKTTLGVDIAENIAKRGQSVLMVSLEMNSKQIMSKRIAREEKLSYNKLMTGGLNTEEFERAMCAASELSSRPFYLTDKSKMTVVDIGREARQIKDCAAIVIDYLGLIQPRRTNSNKPRYEEMTDISADIKALAKLLNIPIIVLCQLNRENTKTADKRPQLQDLRDTGAIEQDADAVILLHRPEYYKDKAADDYEQPEIELIEMIVSKNRHFETGLVKMVWEGSSGDILELDVARSELPFTNGG